MITEIIPFDTSNILEKACSSRIFINGESFILSLKFYRRLFDYFLDVRDSNGEPIFENLRLINNVNCLQGLTDKRFPKGVSITPLPLTEKFIEDVIQFGDIGEYFLITMDGGE